MTQMNVRRRGNGFTVIELLMTMVIGGIVLSAVLAVLSVQSRHQRRQFELMQVRNTLRSAVALVEEDLQQVMPARGDLVAIGSQSVTLRRLTGNGLICRVDTGTSQMALWRPAGEFGSSSDDSVIVVKMKAKKDTTKTKFKVGSLLLGVLDPGYTGMTECVWGPAHRPDVVLQVDTWVDTTQIGGLARAFQTVEYGMVQWNGQWWLGQRVASASKYDVVTGPLVPPGQGGLELRYYDVNDNETTDPLQVVRVQLALRAVSRAKADPRADSLVSMVYLAQ